MICHYCSLPVREPGTQAGGRLWQKQTRARTHIPGELDTNTCSTSKLTFLGRWLPWRRHGPKTHAHTDLSKEYGGMRNMPPPPHTHIFYNREASTPTNIHNIWQLGRIKVLPTVWILTLALLALFNLPWSSFKDRLPKSARWACG